MRSRAWDDEDARLLASAFNTLTESIARFQREAAQKERLSSLGRLSTVIAHEIRNPLMIIRASLASLWTRRRRRRRSGARRSPTSTRKRRRLNRIVTEVLDFAKPIRFDLGEAHVNDICRACRSRRWAGASPPSTCQLDLDPALPPVVTDAERLRTALVNILANARHAVEATPQSRPSRAPRRRPASCSAPAGAAIASSVTIARPRRRHRPRRHGRTSSTRTSRRAAPAPGSGCRSRRTSSKASAARSRSSSRPGEGTEIRIELPLTAAGARHERSPRRRSCSPTTKRRF